MLPALLLVAALMLLLAAAGPAAAQTTSTDYDADDDGLIEIDSHAKLNAIRHDLNGNGLQDSVGASDWAVHTAAFPSPASGQCDDPATTGATETCTGYELTANLNLDTDGSGAANSADAYWNGGSGWLPIGNNSYSFTTTFQGNGHTIANLFISRSSTSFIGLFGVVSGGQIRNLGLTGVNVSGAVYTGSLIGRATNSTQIADASAAGQVSGTLNVGGLAGDLTGSTVTASYAGVNVTNTGNSTGGLVGQAQSPSSITASYATGTVGGAANVGGLVGDLNFGTSVTAGYAVGAVTGASSTGGLVGNNAGSVTNSYYDGGATGQSDTGKGTSQTAAQLQTPTDYTGIYTHWNLDRDSDQVPDYLWNFRAANQYPILNTPAQRAAAVPSAMDYDADDDGLIEIRTAAQLNAVRWDLNVDGDPTPGDATAYSTAFGGRTHTADAATGLMGCPVADGCSGYELAANITLSGAFTPLGDYAAAFDGNGHTISGLRVNVSSGHAGLFTSLTTANGVIRNVGLLNPSVINSAAGGQNSGALVGRVGVGGANVAASYVSGGSVIVSGANARGGGLVGLNQGRIRASYATAAVGHSGNPAGVHLGGLVGYSWGAETVASYAAGPVTASSGSGAVAGGLIGTSDSNDTVTDSYCDRTAMLVTACIGALAGSPVSTAAAAAHSTADLQSPTEYAGGLYANWNLDLDGDTNTDDDPWDFGTDSQYPALKFDTDGNGTPTAYEFGGQGRSAPPPAAPNPTTEQPQPGQSVARGGGQAYHPRADHPESYYNPRYFMVVSCAVQLAWTDAGVTTATLNFHLGLYTRPVTLTLSLWDGAHFRTLQSQGLPTPQLQRDGRIATVQIATDPAQTRFRLDSEYGLNLVLGYADCRTDDPE